VSGSARLARAAEGLVGCRFRLRGRDAETGLDCLGVLALALRGAGMPCDLPRDYALRNRDASRAFEWAPALGLSPVEGDEAVGDVLLLEVGVCQFHFAIRAQDGGFIHAHAGLRRVVHSPTRPDGRVIGHWRALHS